MESAAKKALTDNLQYVSKLEFPAIETKNEYRAITVERARRHPDQWIVSDGGTYWVGAAIVSGDVLPDGRMKAISSYQATRFSLDEAIATAQRLAELQRADYELWSAAFDEMVGAMTAVIGDVYGIDCWSGEPQYGDVCLTLSTNGRGETLNGQINIFTHPANQIPAPHTPEWYHASHVLTNLFTAAGWIVKPNKPGLSVFPPEGVS
jgi:hypothetical protein